MLMPKGYGLEKFSSLYRNVKLILYSRTCFEILCTHHVLIFGNSDKVGTGNQRKVKKKAKNIF